MNQVFDRARSGFHTLLTDAQYVSLDVDTKQKDLELAEGKVKVLVSFFGRETPVELDFLQVERM